ncbi:MAG: SRPBCC family protein, partial [Dehalococcoidia bacterium]|nr:SRPBCC family protein [Dehalococcoidia bacterium]
MPEVRVDGVMAGPPPVVYGVVADVEQYPAFVPNVRRVRLDGDIVEMTVQVGPLELVWAHRVVFDPYRAIRLRLARGPFTHMDIDWTFAPDPAGTAVTYRTQWELSLRVPGAGFIIQNALRANVEQTIRAFQQRVL